MSYEWDYRDDYYEPTRDDMIRELVEGCSSFADIAALAREMRAELRRQRVEEKERARRRREYAAPPPPPPPKTAEELYLDRLPAEYKAKLAARGPSVMDPAEVARMVEDNKAYQRSRIASMAMAMNRTWTA